MTLKHLTGILIAGTAFLLGACGDDTTETPVAVALPVPDVAVSVEGLTATVSWSITPEVEGVRFGYELFSGKDEKPAGSGVVHQRSLTLTIKADVTYKVHVRAVAPTGSIAYLNSEFSDFKEFSSMTPPLVPLEPTTVTLGDVTAESAALSWESVEGAKSYMCELSKADSDKALQTVSTAKTELTLEGLEPSTDYRFSVKVIALKTGCDSDWSEAVEFTTLEKEEEPEEPEEPVVPSVELGLPLQWEADGVLRAFPGAEGGGMYVTGGRGGKVYHVTNLNDSGTGSLRAAVEASGTRIIVFDVAGTIALKRGLTITNGNLTIAGQTAPGGGITLRDFPVTVKADNVIIRYMRFRLGDRNVDDGDDAIWGRYRQDIILDHCSMSWSVDECASFYANRNFTMQWCVLGESLHNSGHSKGSHGYGGIWGGAPASYHHNILLHHDSRNPRFDEPNAYDFTGLLSGKQTTYTAGHGLRNDERMIDYRNNVVYNFCNYPAYGGEGAHINFVGNYYKWGPASVNGLGVNDKGTVQKGARRTYFYQVDCAYTTGGVTYDAGPTEVYYSSNRLDTSVETASTGDAVTADNSKGFTTKNGSKSQLGDAVLQDSRPFAITAAGRGCYVTEHSASDAFSRAVAYAGASLWRDAVDKRMADDVLNGKANVAAGSAGSKNGIIDSPRDTAVASSAFGEVDSDGYPRLTATDEEIQRAAVDTDADGIPDYYEKLLGLDAADASDAQTTTLDPQHIYPNIEVYFHYLVREITAAQCEGGDYKLLN